MIKKRTVQIQLVSNNQEFQNFLHVQTKSKEISSQVTQEALKLEIEYQGKTYKSSGKNSDFEKQLKELENELPSDVYLKICFNCRLSEYPPNIVNSSKLRCFKNAKSEFKKIKDKWAFIELWTEKGIDVDETYLCPEFEKRPPFVWR